MSSVWKGSIALGMLNIPVKAAVAARETGISFNLLHAACGSRINQKTWCAACEQEITRAETVKGFDDGGTFLRIDPDEIQACAPESSRVMEITAVADAASVDPIRFEASYYLEAEEAGRKGYKLLAEALRAEKKVALASITLSQREHVAVIRPYAHGLVFHTMFYASEVREATCNVADVPVNAKELALARQLLGAHAIVFNPSAYADGYQQKLQELIEAKRAKKPAPKQPPAKAAAPKMDLMAALAASLRAKGKAA